MNIIEELKSAREEVSKQRKLVELEMEEKGNKGKLWQNGMCAAWPAYERAINALDELRKQYGV